MLTWLYNQVISLWNTIRANAGNAYFWARQKANEAYNNAVAWARREVGIVLATAWSIYASVRNYARDLYNQAIWWIDRQVGIAKATALSLFTSAKYFARGLYNQSIAWINRQIGIVKATALSLWKSAEIFATRLYNSVKAWALKQIDIVASKLNIGIKAVEDWIKETFEWLFTITPDDIKKLLYLLQTGWGVLFSFLSNPFSFIVAIMTSMILPILEWSLAYAMGTEKYELPPFPDWASEGFGGAIIVGTGPPSGSSGLAPPLDNIYVSGYPFRIGHPGVDLGLRNGDPVYAMHAGSVIFSGWHNATFGYCIVLESNEWWTRYAHLQTLLARRGDVVGRSDQIATGDSTGNSTGPHLHLEIKHRGSFIDPMTVL